MKDKRIPLFKVLMADDAPARVANVLRSGYIGQGPEVEAFEAELCTALGTPTDRLLTTSSCTAAIALALRCLHIGKGDEVITTPMTCVATNAAILATGASITWADVDPETGLIHPGSVASRVTPWTKAIVAVDWGGAPCDYAAIRELTEDKIPIIEDAAHAFGATVNGEPLLQRGGDWICWSFQAVKHLTTGDGGLLKCPASEVDRARRLRWFGYDRRDKASFRTEQRLAEVGGKWHMNDVAAAIGRANLALALRAVERHRTNANIYAHALASLSDVFSCPEPNPDSSWWLYTLRVDDRDGFVRYMDELGIDVSPVHVRNDAHPGFEDAVKRSSAPPLGRAGRIGLDAFAAYEVAIPVGWWLGPEDLVRVVAAVEAWAWKRKS